MSTRRPLTLAELTGLLEPIGRPVAERTLEGGLFASVQAVDLDDGRCVVTKTGQPDGSDGLLTHERNLLRGEIELLRLAAALPGVPAPRVLLTDLTRTHVEVDVMVAEMLPGDSWHDSHPVMTPDAERAAAEAVGAVLAELHTVTGDRFGYPEAASGVGGATWPEAFGAMMTALLADAERWGVEVDAALVRAAVASSTDQLAEVTTPHLIHMDLWPGNVLLDPGTGLIRGVVDFERGLFADPLMDLVGHEPFLTGPLSPGPIAGYTAAGGSLPIDPTAGTVTGLTAAAHRRLTLYRLYLTLIMTIEVVPRKYTWDDLGEYVGRVVRDRAVLLEQLGT